MITNWAFIYGHPGADPVADRLVLERGGVRTVLVPVPEESGAAPVAAGLVEDGAQLIELCGGFSAEDTARVVAAVDGRAPVGSVSYSSESIVGLAGLIQSSD